MASKTANISLICHQWTNTICAAEIVRVIKTRINAIYATSRDGDHRYRRQGQKSNGDIHYRLKCLGKTSDGNNCEARRVVTGSNEAYNWQQLKLHTHTMAGVVQTVVQCVATTAVVSDLVFAPIPLPPVLSLRSSFFSSTHMHTFMAF